MSKMTVTIEAPVVTADAAAAEIAVATNTPVVHTDEYEGEYTVTVTDTAQTLETKGLKMKDDLTVNPLAAWRGVYHQKDQGDYITLFTEGLRMTDNVVIDPLDAYTGSYEVTPSEQAQTLETDNLRMTDDVSIAAIPARYKDMSGDNAWLGPGAEWLGQVCSQEFTLADTTFDDWTASTTAGTIRAAQNVYTFTADPEYYEYFIRWRSEINVAYLAGATLKAVPIRFFSSMVQNLYRKPNSLANVTNENFNQQYCATLASAAWLDYRNTSGNATLYAGTYGLYTTLAAATFSSSTAAAPTVTVKTPAVTARCNSSYFATDRKEEVDSANSTVKIVGDLYRVPVGWGVLRNCYADAADIYNNGL